MNKLIAVSAAALALGLVSAPAMAADGQVDGFGSLEIGHNTLNPGSYSDTYCYSGGSCYGQSIDDGITAKGLDVNARVTVAVPLGGMFGGQVDGQFSRTAYHMNGQYESVTIKFNQSTVAAHAYARLSDTAVLGVIGQRTAFNTNFNTGGGRFGPFGSSLGGRAVYYIGGEGQVALGKATLAAQVVYGSDDSTYTNSAGVNASAQVRYFLQDNAKITLRGGLESFKVTPDQAYYTCTYSCYSNRVLAVAVGLNGEYRLPGSAVSLTADADYRAIKGKYRYFYTDGSYNDNLRSTYGDLRFMVGVKLNFGSKTLIERDRSGASFDTVRPLGIEADAIGYNSYSNGGGLGGGED
jgi:hypothetical protein